MQKIYVIRNNNDAIWVYIAVKKALILSLSPNSSDSPISDSIAWNTTKFYIQYILKDGIDINFESIAC